MARQASQNASIIQQPPLVLHPGAGIGSALPGTLTSFVGRDREMQALEALLRQADTRLVTLVGPGGVGKTRLAIEVASRLAEQFPDGISFVDLSAVVSSTLLEPVIARALGMREQADRPLPERAADILGDRKILLVLDNFEPFVTASPLVASMLVLCPRMTALVTSREPLRLSGERVVSIPPLSLPDPGHLADAAIENEAVRLFVERATAIRSDFALNNANIRPVTEIVRRLDGLPLAIELAAARLAHLPPVTLLRRLDRRLPILTGGARDLPERQRTMRGAIAWSYDLSTPDEQRVFRMLAAFVGGCRFEAAEAVSATNTCPGGMVLDLLASLVSRSLLRQDQDFDGEPRFTMLETVREFGVEQLVATGEEDVVHDRHAAYFLDLVERADPAIWGGPDHGYWLDRLEAELANVEAALHWLERTGNGPAFLRLAAALGGLWHYRSHRAEGRVWLKQALEIGGDSVTAARAMAFIKLGMLERVSGGTNAAELVTQGLALRRQLGDQRGIGRALMNLGNVLKDQAAYDLAMPTLEEAVRLLEPVGDIGGLATTRTYMGMVLLEQGDTGHAWMMLTDALALHHQDGFNYGVASTLLTLGYIEAGRGNVAVAAAHYAESLRLWVQVKNSEGLVEAIAATAALAVANGQLDTGARLLGAAAAHADALGYIAPAQNRKRHSKAATVARSALGARRFDAAWEAGRSMMSGQAVTEATDLVALVSNQTAKIGVLPVAASVLTPRELSVLRLLVEGLSDREIALQLGISYRTVTSYVRNILTKFNVQSRTAAATHAVRHDLV